MLEKLETRRLLSASLDGAGLLTVLGTSATDTITVNVADPAEATPQDVVVTINGVDQTFAASEVVNVLVKLMAGDDVYSSNLNRPSTIQGGAGNDSIMGGSNNDLIKGGAGMDTLEGCDGNDELVAGAGVGGVGSLLIGGMGFDTLKGGDASDTLRGGNNGDQIYGYFGALDISINPDEIWAGKGHDLVTVFKTSSLTPLVDATVRAGANIDGGEGSDTIFGGQFNDIVYAQHGNSMATTGSWEWTVTTTSIPAAMPTPSRAAKAPTR
jgi:Ca2+-binding RTX toxin-like protein